MSEQEEWGTLLSEVKQTKNKLYASSFGSAETRIDGLIRCGRGSLRVVGFELPPHPIRDGGLRPGQLG